MGCIKIYVSFGGRAPFAFVDLRLTRRRAAASSRAMRFKLTVSYDGRAFTGWQSQPHGGGVQNVLESAIMEICGEDIRVRGAGRTDAGVHATGQVAHFDAPEGSRMDARAWQHALHTKLGPEVRIMQSEAVPETFNAQFSATGKLYEYRICRLPVMPPLENGMSWHVPYRMSFERLLAICEEVQGRHDFSAFAANRRDGRQDFPGYALRHLFSVIPEEHDGFLTLKFHGEGFLYKMVRLLTGSMMRVALGREKPEWLCSLLHEANGRKSQFVAPAGGLYLRRVEYGLQDHHTPKV